MSLSRGGRITAVLGPTNTGKTYLAIERMLGYRNGMIGFPLRLLARENYDRAVKLKGRAQVALITGEEKIVPPRARYFFCTVESMPLDRPVEFLAIDEIQLAGDRERGHVFTDRLLHARGSEETMLLGADTIRLLLRSMVPEAEIVSRPRFSVLSHSGARKLSRLPARSAVVAFSAAEVYTLAELIRRQRGGTAVVLGALSPRTRNAQVGLFESGEVDYLVATDAIGMGLNLHLDHVAFSRLRKYDGRAPRDLTPAEVGQIAGRAGRHMNDGTFGTTSELGAMSPELVEAVEAHSFESLPFLYWRSRKLDLSSAAGLLRSLDQAPPMATLVRAPEAEDQRALAALAREPEIAKRASNPEAVALLWDVCRIPDFRKTLTDQHVVLLRRVYRHLLDGEGALPEDWVNGQIRQLDRTEGDIDALVARIAHIRTWTYIAHRGDWFEDAAHWQERTRAIEDRLSDALHERLAQRFVDRRTAALVRRMKGGDPLVGAIRESGEVLVEGEYIGRLQGFRLVLDKEAEGADAKALRTAARRALATQIPVQLRRLEDDGPEAFSLGPNGEIAWRGAPVARLAKGSGPLSPRAEPLTSEWLDSSQKDRIAKRLGLWLDGYLRGQLAVLFRAVEADTSPVVRGLLFQVAEALGAVPRAAVAESLRGLDRADRKVVGGLDLRVGAASVYFPALLKPRPARLRALLWSIHHERALPDIRARNRPSLSAEDFAALSEDSDALWALGYHRFKSGKTSLALRIDSLERLAGEARKLSRQGSFMPTAALLRIAGCTELELAMVLKSLGYRADRTDDGISFLPRAGRNEKGKARKPRRRSRPRKEAPREDSPFAKLRDLKVKS